MPKYVISVEWINRFRITTRTNAEKTDAKVGAKNATKSGPGSIMLITRTNTSYTLELAVKNCG